MCDAVSISSMKLLGVSDLRIILLQYKTVFALACKRERVRERKRNEIDRFED